MQVRNTLYIDGHWARPADDGAIDVSNPATEKIFASVPEGTGVDVDRAVDAARRAFADWSSTSPGERAEVIQRLADGLSARVPALGELIALEVGTPLSMATLVQAGAPALVMETYAGLAREFEFEEWVAHSLVVREAVGVAACVTPWNFPLYLAVCKVAPALAAGCTVVLKPSELAPLSAFVLAEVADEAGVPPGVFNLVSGRASVGEALVSHPGVDMVSFTGATERGRRVAELAGRALTRVTLELGGKSANVVLDDADLEEAVRAGVSQCFLNSGQTCISWARMLVPRHQHDDAVGMAKQVVDSMVVGDPFDPDTTMGPLVSSAQRARVQRFVHAGVDEGATLATGGPEAPVGMERGWYVQPTVFADVSPEASIAQEEVFGPVLAIIPYDGDDDAVRIANGTRYGLHGAVFSSDAARAESVARRMRTGQVDVNGAGMNLLAPFGGFNQSGWGRELGVSGLAQYLDTKSLQLPPRSAITRRGARG